MEKSLQRGVGILDPKFLDRPITEGLLAFVDDSGSPNLHEWYVLAGYVSTPERWNHFSDKWQEVLDEDPKMEMFKGNRVYAKHTVWSSMTEDDRSARLHKFIDVIGECTMRAAYVAVRRADYDEVLRDHLYSEVRSPFYWLFLSMIKSLESCERHSGDTRRLNVIFDRDDVHPEIALNLLKSQYFAMGFSQRLAFVGFGDDESTIPLQAADLLAWQVRHALCNPDKPSPHHDRCLQAPQLPAFGQFLTNDDLEGLRDVMLQNAEQKGLRLVHRRIGGTDRKPIMSWEVERELTE